MTQMPKLSNILHEIYQNAVGFLKPIFPTHISNEASLTDKAKSTEMWVLKLK